MEQIYFYVLKLHVKERVFVFKISTCKVYLLPIQGNTYTLLHV
jgi:hypothetical protein